jgi:integrase
MASIRRRETARGAARYDVRVRLGERVLTRTFQRRQDGERWARLIEAGRVRGDAVDPRAGEVALEDYSVRWMASRRLAPRTRELYADLHGRFIAPVLGRVALARISPEQIRVWHHDLAERVSGIQAAKAYRFLRAVLNTAVDDGLIARNPCRIPGAGQERSPERPLVPPETALALVDAIEPRYRALVLLAATGGLRLGELLALRRRDLDLDGGTVRVNEQLVQLRDGTQLRSEPKTAAGRRIVAIPSVTVEVLRKHLDLHAEHGNTGLVFCNPGGGPLRRATLYNAWHRARADVGADNVTLHDLRHAGATLAAQAGATTRELMARLGHASPRAALRYQHASTERDRELATRLDAIFTRPRDGRAMETDGNSPEIDDHAPDLGL